MNLSGLVPLLDVAPGYRGLLDSLVGSLAQREQDSFSAHGAGAGSLSLCVPEPARPYVLASLQHHWRGPILLVASRPERARRLYDELRVWSETPERVLHFPAPEALPYDRVSWERETVRQRLSVLALLSGEESSGETPLSRTVVVASAWALMAKTIPARLFRRGTRRLHAGQTLVPHKFMRWLMDYGYEPSTVVEEPCTFSHRGGILDIFSPASPDPVRLEFFGDQVESIRAFDARTQRSEATTDMVVIVPASEALPLNGPYAARLLREMQVEGSRHLSRNRREREVQYLAERQPFRGMEYYVSYLYPQPGMLTDYLPDDGIVVVDDMLALETAARALENQAMALRDDLIEEKELHPAAPAAHSEWAQLLNVLGTRRVYSLAYEGTGKSLCLPEGTFRTAPRYGGRLAEAVEELSEHKKVGRRVTVVSRQSPRLAELFQERGVHVILGDALEEIPPRGSLTLVQGSLDEGFLLSTPSTDGEGRDTCVLYTDAEIFGWTRPHQRRRRPQRRISPESFFADLSVGDHVVHFEHGIGVYRGTVRKVMGSVEHEYLELEYAAGDKLYVPVQQVGRLSRYVGLEDHPPTLHRLGTAEWSQVRERAQKAVEDIAHELLEVYAAREVVRGHAFQADTPWQADLEASFPYDETEDQVRAIVDVKADMEQSKPMDRLICGDVGYGKTEVALRAAFKAVMDGKQVAVLVPTTVLAQQHYLTFQYRLDPFPVKVEMLSRFRSRREQRQILDELGVGKVDIVVGTHRLIQNDVVFSDLGLLIIDEEQRFGVKHKERLKQLRRQVDVLTMTATPIPRTLHLSLTGVRDMSTIDTPPEERLPVRTFVIEFDEALIRKAILREMDRGGQVYFVHNRVQSIGYFADRVREMVPEASIAIAHGQMDEEQLGRVMVDFSGGLYDVLVCTTIIESGLDIPNVNTILIDRADTFGLAQLYQLRGRVGRSVNQAYAYLMYDHDKGLTPVSQSRLEAILEASELGAGFRIAMRDLEIRGAGEILGVRQHGHIAAIGFDLYCRLLTQAIRDLREGGGEVDRVSQAGERQVALSESLEPGPSIDLPISAYIPADYVGDSNLRLRLYRRLVRLGSLEEVDAVTGEFRDRFGELPPVVRNLLYILRLKIMATDAGVQSIGLEDEFILVRLRPGVRVTVALPEDADIRVRRNQVWLDRVAGWEERLFAILEAILAVPQAEAV